MIKESYWHGYAEIYNGQYDIDKISVVACKSQKEMIDEMIEALHKVNCDNGDHDWIENHCLQCGDIR